MIPSEKCSVILSASFDWSKSSITGKVTRKQEAFKYEPRRLAQADYLESNYPYEVVDTKLRIRGAGRTVRLRYESSAGKDFRVLGYAIVGVDLGDTGANK